MDWAGDTTAVDPVIADPLAGSGGGVQIRWLGLSPAQPSIRMAMSMNHADHADAAWIDLVVDAVREPAQQDAPKVAADNRLTLGRFLDRGDGVVNGVEKVLGGSG